MKSKKSSLNKKRHSIFERTKIPNLRTIHFFIFALLFPYIIEFTSDSTYTYTEFLAGAGGGQYVYHDCSGAHTQNFTDAGIYVGKKFESPFRVGLSIGGWSEKQTFGGIFPDIALDWKQFSIGTTGVRLGDRNDFYVEGKLADQPPFLSGKGLLRFGVGGKFNNLDTRIWFGTNVLPYNNLGFATQIEIPFDEKKYIYINGRVGTDKTSGLGEYGISVGVRLVDF